MIVLIVGLAVFPLSDYLKEVEDCSACEQCDKLQSCFAKRKFFLGKYLWLDELMMVSFIKVRSYCKYCRKLKCNEAISYLITGFLLMMAFFWSGESYFTTFLYVICTGALLSLSVVDWNTQYIPFECTIVIFICGCMQLFADFSNWTEHIIGLIAVSGFLYIVNLISTPILKKRYEGEQEVDGSIGGGDIKLMAATGLLLGWKLNFIALGIGCVLGSVIHSILIKVKKGDRQFALGPYLSLGVYITMICGKQLVSWYLNMMGIKPL